MKKAMTPQEINELHKDEFGVYPVFTGKSVFMDETPTDLILASILNGKPYIESEVKESIVI